MGSWFQFKHFQPFRMRTAYIQFVAVIQRRHGTTTDATMCNIGQCSHKITMSSYTSFLQAALWCTQYAYNTWEYLLKLGPTY